MRVSALAPAPLQSAASILASFMGISATLI